MPQHELIELFIKPLEKAGMNYMVTGSVAAIFYGEPRLTHDVDIVIQLPRKDIERFVTLFPAESYYCPPPDIIHIEIQRGKFSHFNLLHQASGLKADCYPFDREPLTDWALKHKREIVLSEQQRLWLAPPEYVILRKLQYFKEGHSHKHVSDIIKMLNAGVSLDDDYLAQMIRQMDLKKTWDENIRNSPQKEE